jgi:hypothetical protein
MVCLCDPNLDIISTSRVTPQQREWVQEAVCNPEEGSLFGKLPRELLDSIVENVDGLMSRKEAEGFREQLMRERTAFVDQHSTDFFGVVCSFTLPLSAFSLTDALFISRVFRNSACDTSYWCPLTISSPNATETLWRK